MNWSGSTVPECKNFRRHCSRECEIINRETRNKKYNRDKLSFKVVYWIKCWGDEEEERGGKSIWSLALKSKEILPPSPPHKSWDIKQNQAIFSYKVNFYIDEFYFYTNRVWIWMLILRLSKNLRWKQGQETIIFTNITEADWKCKAKDW
jgi:hypothetical protein